MNKSNLVARVSKVTDLPRTKAEQAVNSMLETIQEALKKGEKVTLVGFGTFTAYKRKSRKGRNPKTGETIKISPKKVVKFKAGTKLSLKIE